MIGLVTNNLKQIEEACQRFDVDALWVFGSAVTGRWIEGRSDIDFIAHFGTSDLSLFRQHMGFIGALEDTLGVRVDVIDSRGFARARFRDDVESIRVKIYERPDQAISA